jgi:hemerythrin-like domain-containing protein
MNFGTQTLKSATKFLKKFRMHLHRKLSEFICSENWLKDSIKNHIHREAMLLFETATRSEQRDWQCLLKQTNRRMMVDLNLKSISVFDFC